MITEHRQGKGDTLVKLSRDGNRVTITSRRMGYPITLEVNPELLEFLQLAKGA